MGVFLLTYSEHMTELSKQYYELAFHVTTNLEDADVQKTRQDVENILTSNGGVISFSKDLEKIRLAYPIKHQTSSYFGFFNFNLESPEDSVSKIREDLKLNSNILRFLILKHQLQPKVGKEDLIRKMAAVEKRKLKAAKEADKSKGDAPKLDEKAIEEKLEEIIDKL